MLCVIGCPQTQQTVLQLCSPKKCEQLHVSCHADTNCYTYIYIYMYILYMVMVTGFGSGGVSLILYISAVAMILVVGGMTLWR